MLEALEAEDGQNENDEPCIEADDDGDEHSEVSVEEGEALDFPAMLEQVETDLNAISVLREEIALKEEDIGTRRSALDNAVVRLEAAGYDCNTGDESRHLEDVIDELMGFLSILRAEEAESGESLHIDDCESQLSDCVARLEERGLLNAAETMQKYGSLRLGLGIIGVDCEGAIAQGDKAQLQDSCLQAMLNAYGDVLYEKKKIQDLKRDMPNAMTEYRRKGYLEVITEHEAALAQHEVEYQEARLRMEEVGLCPPPADKMPALEVENSTAGSIDIADFLAAQQRDDDEGPDANVNKISSLPGLIDVPKEAQLTRWRYSLGAFDEETQWDMPASASDDGCWDDLPSMCGDDSLSVRGGFVSEMSDQRKLAVWRAEEDKARLAVARLRDEMYDGLAALFED